MTPVVDPRIAAFLDAGVLVDVDLRVAHTLGRIGGERDPDVLLAAALAVRAPRHGHVCVELDRVAERIVGDTGPLPLPEPAAWQDRLAGSALVRAGGDGSSPLVLAAGRVYLDRYWGYQQRLAATLRDRFERPPAHVDRAALAGHIEVLFGSSARQPGVDRQRVAAAMAALRRITVVSGGPGTGKTTTVAKILALLHEVGGAGGRPLRAAVAAPTGKAANRLQEAIGEALPDLPVDDEVRAAVAVTPALTIHRLLGTFRDRSTRFRHDADHPLPHDVVIVDEASMVSLALMTKLADAVHRDARLVLVGDRDQLASVEAGAVLGDVCGPAGGGGLRLSAQCADELAEATGQDVRADAEVVDTAGIWDAVVRLNRFYRFGEDSGIGGVARAIQATTDDPARPLAFLRGAATEAGAGSYDDITLVDRDDPDAVPDGLRREILGAYRHFVEQARAGAPPRTVLEALGRVRVLCAHRRGPDGIHDWNARIERWLAESVEGLRTDVTWYVGRPVIVTANDYSVRLFNGDIGAVVADPEAAGGRTVVFESADGRVRRLSPSRLPDCETAFALTIHKSQGSQFGHAVVVLPDRESPILTRELVYTGITRARERVTVLAAEPVLRAALVRPVQRASGLRDVLWEP